MSWQQHLLQRECDVIVVVRVRGYPVATLPQSSAHVQKSHVLVLARDTTAVATRVKILHTQSNGVRMHLWKTGLFPNQHAYMYTVAHLGTQKEDSACS